MGCICLIPSNKYNKRQKEVKLFDNTGPLSTKIITANSASNHLTLNRQTIHQMTPSLWLIILQFLSLEDLYQVAQCNKELKEITKINERTPIRNESNCVINMNKTLNNCKENIADSHNISKDSYQTIFNSNLLPLASKTNNTHSFNHNISSFSNANNINEIDHNKKNNEKLITAYTHSSEPSKQYPVKARINKIHTKSLHGREGTIYIDTFTQQQIDLSNNSLSIYKRKSLSNLSSDFENKTPSFSEDNSTNNNRIVNITNINTILITPIILNTKAKGSLYANQMSGFSKKDNG